MEGMSFKEFLSERNRMCEKLGDCTICPMFRLKHDLKMSCVDSFVKCPNEAEEIVRKWAEENPIPTNLDVLIEFLNDKLGFEISSSAPTIGECIEIYINHEFWKQPYKEPTHEQG